MSLKEKIKELEETRKQIDVVIRERFCYSSEELLDNFDKTLSIIKKLEEVIEEAKLSLKEIANWRDPNSGYWETSIPDALAGCAKTTLEKINKLLEE